MTVANGGTEIQTIKTTFSAFSCGGRTQSGTITSSQTPTWPVTDRQFDIQLSFFPGDVKLNVTGSFAESGVEASGTWSVDVLGTICPGTWGPVINVSVEEMDDAIPKAFALDQNYPNPFNPMTSIAFELPVSSQIRMSVYDMLGRRVSMLLDRVLNAGVHCVEFSGKDLPSGSYVYRLDTPHGSFSRTMLLMK